MDLEDCGSIHGNRRFPISYGFAAPEIIENMAPSCMTDVFALGMVGWEMGIGRNPFVLPVRCPFEWHPTHVIRPSTSHVP